MRNSILKSLVLLAVVGSLAGGVAHAKTTVCPGPNTLPGIDVSYWQSNIDWAKVKASGKKFAIMRANHALAADTKFDYNWAQCHAQGLHCGAYCYFEPAMDVNQQADLLLAKIGKLQPGDISPVIDVEATGGLGPAAVAAAVGKWIERVEKATGRKPIIYSGGYFWEGNVKSNAFVSYPLWHPQYCSNCCPNIASPWTKWYFWQYSSTGSVSGISGNVDMNHWNGTAADLDAFTGDNAPPACTPGCQGTVMQKADCSKSDCAPGDGTCVNDSLGLRCISKFCPAKGSATVCLPSKNNALVGTCKDGKLSTGDCSAYGALCSTVAAAEPKCVSAFCAKDATTKPVVKDVCLPDGIRYACAANGDIAKKPCPADSTCVMQGDTAICKPKGCKPTCDGSKIVDKDCGTIDCAAKAVSAMCVLDAQGPHCVDTVCPPTGSSTVCLAEAGAMAIGICLQGQLTKATCKKGLEVCVEVGAATTGTPTTSGAVCASALCATNPPNLSAPHDVCGEDGSIVHCDAMGKATVDPCPAGQGCKPEVIPPACSEPPAPDGDAGSSEDALTGSDAAARTAEGDVGGAMGGAGVDDSGLSGGDGLAAGQVSQVQNAAPSSGCGAGAVGLGLGTGVPLLVSCWLLRRRRVSV